MCVCVCVCVCVASGCLHPSVRLKYDESVVTFSLAVFFFHISLVCVRLLIKRTEVHETGCGRHGARSSHASF